MKVRDRIAWTRLSSDYGSLDVSVESGDDLSTDLLVPLQRLLDQCKSAKALSRKLVKRVEDLVEDSAALKHQVVPQLRALNNRVPELVNFGIQVILCNLVEDLSIDWEFFYSNSSLRQ